MLLDTLLGSFLLLRAPQALAWVLPSRSFHLPCPLLTVPTAGWLSQYLVSLADTAMNAIPVQVTMDGSSTHGKGVTVADPAFRQQQQQ